MTKLYNPERHLSPEIIQPCFIEGKITNVDKQVCGNGFSTSFFNMLVPKGFINIIIAPNKQFLIDKEESQIKGEIGSFNRIKFFYAEGEDSSFGNADILVFVADSFLRMTKKLKRISPKIKNILIDENHSKETQSLYRGNLVNLEEKIKEVCNEKTAIVSVTASPNLFNKVDILIENKHIRPSVINHSKDRESALNRVKEDIKNNKHVVVFTNSSKVCYHLRNRKGELKARFIIGNSFRQSLVELVKAIHDEDSKLTIISAKGFEGFDLQQENANAYFFEDRSNEHETFFISNLYQAVNRLRKGAKYIEYNRQDISSNRKEIFKNIDNEISAFVSQNFKHKGKIQSTENKQNGTFKHFHKYVEFVANESGKFIIKKNKAAIDLYKETLLYDKPFPAPEFKKFLAIRKITINHLNENNNRTKEKIKTSTKVGNLLRNADMIEKHDLFGVDYYFIIKQIKKNSKGKPVYDNRLAYLRELEKYLRRKNHNGCRVSTSREKIALELLSNEVKYFKLIREMTKAYDIRSINKYGRAGSETYRRNFRNGRFNIVCQLISMFVNDHIQVPPNWIAHRNYNLTTKIGVDEIKLVARLFNVSVTEVDIKSCFLRVLYALNGLELGKNPYGEDKRNKLAINIYLNDFFYNEASMTEKKHQKENAIRKLTNLGFGPVVIQYLMNNFFEAKFKGDLFNTLSFYERSIISEVKDRLKKLNNDGVIRRHDSVLVFNNGNSLHGLNRFKALGVKGWFDIKKIKVIKLVAEPIEKPKTYLEYLELMRG